jgi:hypothetical protein
MRMSDFFKHPNSSSGWRQNHGEEKQTEKARHRLGSYCISIDVILTFREVKHF